MKLAPFVALFALFAISPLLAQTTEAYQITLGSENYPYTPYSFSLTSNPVFTGLSVESYDSNYGANVWTWSNNNPSSLQTSLFHSISGTSVAGSYTEIFYEQFAINSQGFLTYSVTSNGLTYSSQPVTAVGWGINIGTYTFPTAPLTLSDFLSTLSGSQGGVGTISFLFGNQTSATPGISEFSVEAVTVPEPSTVALLGGAGGLLLWVRRFYRRNACRKGRL